MVWERLKKELILTGIDAAGTDDVFEVLGSELIRQGYCKDSYVQALKEREAEYPTGINMGAAGVAIPHTNVDHVKEKAIAIGTLKQPVRFMEMGSDEDYVDVQLVFMLAVDEKGHLELLQAILAILQDAEVVNQIIRVKDAEEIINIIREKENSNE